MHILFIRQKQLLIRLISYWFLHHINIIQRKLLNSSLERDTFDGDNNKDHMNNEG